MATEFAYIHMSSILLREILNGTLNIGDKMPSENQLMADFQVSRNTARRALLEIEEYGLIKRIQGKGSFVIDNKMQQNLQTVKSMTELFADNKKLTYSKVLAVETTKPSGRAKEHLKIPNGIDAIRVYRLRYSEDIPVALNETFFRKEDFQFLLKKNLENISLYQYISFKTGLTIGREEKELEMVPLQLDEAKMLSQHEGAQAFLMRAKAWDQDGNLFSYNTTIYRGDKIKFVYTFSV
jgi:GntR family transcriptional regulator